MGFLLQIKAIVIASLIIGCVLLPATIIVMPLPLNKRLKILCPIWKFFADSMLHRAAYVNIDIREDLRSDDLKPVPSYGIYIANHQSYVDIPLLLTIFQVPPIMKKEVMLIPIFGWVGFIAGAMPVSRSNGGSRKKVFQEAKERILVKRVGVQYYPEGTRSKDATPKPFSLIKKSLLVFAFNEGVPVIPTSIYGTRGVLSLKGIVPGRHLGVKVHQEIYPQDFKTSDEFAEACWNKVTQGHDEMKAKLAPLNENLSWAKAHAL